MFKKRIKLLRKEMNLTQEQLADKLNVGRTTISAYEIGSREPDFETLELIADFFNADIDYLLGKTDVRRLYTFISNDDTTLTDAINIIMFKKCTILNELIIKLSKLPVEEIEALNILVK